MKSIIIAALAVLLTVCLCSCGGNDTVTGNSSSEMQKDSSAVSETQYSSGDDSNEETSEIETSWFSAPAGDVVGMCYAFRSTIVYYNIELIVDRHSGSIRRDQEVIAVFGPTRYADYEKEKFEGTPKEAFERVDKNAALYQGKDYFDVSIKDEYKKDPELGYDFVIENESERTVGNFETYQYEGYVLDEQGKKILIYGYSFVSNGFPVAIMGCELDTGLFEDLKAEIDMMMASITTAR